MLKKCLHGPNQLKAQPAAKFVKAANQFLSEVTLEKGGHRVNGKSMMSVMELANHTEEGLILSVDGEDAALAMDVLSSLLGEER